MCGWCEGDPGTTILIEALNICTERDARTGPPAPSFFSKLNLCRSLTIKMITYYSFLIQMGNNHGKQPFDIPP